ADHVLRVDRAEDVGEHRSEHDQGQQDDAADEGGIAQEGAEPAALARQGGADADVCQAVGELHGLHAHQAAPMRGSIQACSRSITMLATITNSEDSSSTPSRIDDSRASTASSASRPMPGQPNSDSMTTAPPSRLPRW